MLQFVDLIVKCHFWWALGRNIIQSVAMKSRHRKNKSLVNEHSRSNPYTHCRSFSYNRYPQLSKNIPPHIQGHVPDLFVSESITLPLSTDYNREARTAKKGSSKQGSQQLQREKKPIKSKDKDSNLRKPKVNSKPMRDRPSNQRADKSDRKTSKELLRNKPSHEKAGADLSSQRRPKNSEEKKMNGDKGKIEKGKGKSGKRRPNLEDGTNWEEVLKAYSDRLTPEEEAQIRDYKWVYFLGKIKERKARGNPLSARQHRIQEKEMVQSGNSYSRRWEASDEFYQYELGDHIAYRYQILDSINKGSFGEVLRVRDHKSGQEVAVKVVKKSADIVQQTYVQVAILTHIKEKDRSDVSGIVRIKDFTIFRSHICIVFELLEGNLYELLESNHYNGLSEEVIRIFAVQILSALAFLQQERIIHCDIKPQNIVMRSWGKSRVKLIDFGSSCFAGQQVFEYLQSRYYRAPQVMLRRPYSYEIDMWSFACLLLELRLGEPVFAANNNTQQLLYISSSIGLPDPSQGRYSRQFLESEQFKEIIRENYLEQYRYMIKNEIDPRSHPFFAQCKYARNCMRTIRQRIESCHSQHDPAFISFIERILVWEPERRLRPQQALQDPWILKGLPEQIKEYYTILNSGELSKDSKGKRKEKSKSKGKRSNDKPRKQVSGGKGGRESHEAKAHFNYKAHSGHQPSK